MYELTFLVIAKEDIQNIVNYYDTINPKLTDTFLVELEQTINYIQNTPKSCQERLKNIRVSYLKRFRYGVYFKIYNKNIVVLAVLHTSRNPKIWENR